MYKPDNSSARLCTSDQWTIAKPTPKIVTSSCVGLCQQLREPNWTRYRHEQFGEVDFRVLASQPSSSPSLGNIFGRRQWPHSTRLPRPIKVHTAESIVTILRARASNNSANYLHHK